MLLLRPNSDLFYLTGIEQEESVLLLYPDAHEEDQREILFIRQSTTDLSGVNAWLPTTNFILTNSFRFIGVTNTTNGMMFFRAEQP